ncbi:MAG TPA: SRPBCC family protein [Thermoanaerobaculia bacterium]|nr:SRPBCC family protein [Thermoanaerobaculia bacterium]
MSRFLRLVWLLLGLSSFAFLVVLFLLPSGWTVERRRDVAAPPERIYPLLDDLRAWRRWSPWQEAAYPGLVFRYAAVTRGPGAEVTWNSEATGDGRLRVEASDPPRQLAFSMAFQKGRIVARDTLRLQPLPGGHTRVTWTDRGTLGHTLLGRLSLRLIETSMGRDLDRGLGNLAAVAEGRPLPPPAPAPSANAPR